MASSRDDEGISWFLSSCGASVGFLTRYDGELRKPVVWCQGSQVPIRVASGSGALLSSHGRGIGPQDALKDFRVFFKLRHETLGSLDLCR